MTAELNDIELKTSSLISGKIRRPPPGQSPQSCVRPRTLPGGGTPNAAKRHRGAAGISAGIGDARLEQELTAELDHSKIRRPVRIELLLSGELDANNAIFAIHPGASGTGVSGLGANAAPHVCAMGGTKGFKVETLDLQAGEEAASRARHCPSTAPTPMAI